MKRFFLIGYAFLSVFGFFSFWWNSLVLKKHSHVQIAKTDQDISSEDALYGSANCTNGGPDGM